MALRVRVVPKPEGPEDVPVARQEPLAASYTMTSAVDEIDKAIRSGRPLRLMLLDGGVLEVEDPRSCQSIAVADAAVVDRDDDPGYGSD
jgi:hypothetical protein